ncbi:MAG TPA: serine-type D-Ala-D-Ala carboxypeptidase [Porticoccaceae bacterium]|nr:serine-type D-Ala-D-Ala carboxypeptidase [Porticoccaceae bacterium]
MLKERLLTAFICAVLSMTSLHTLGQEAIPTVPQTAAKSWILVDADTGFVLAEHNADELLPPASLAKMMTTYIVSKQIDKGALGEFDNVVISDNAWEKGGAKTDGSTMFLNPRSQVPVIDLMRGVIIQSGNDAAIALAEHVSGSEDAFSELMSETAVQLGMDSTQYYNSTGLPEEGMVSTARDLSVLAREVIQGNSAHYAIYSEKYFQHNNINQPNRNRLLWRDSSVDGLKTGYTQEAGYCLVTTAKRRDMRLISVLMGAPSDETRARESQKLLSYGFRHFDTKQIYSANQIIKENAKVWYGEDDFLNLSVSENIVLTFPRRSEKLLTAKTIVDEQIEAPILAGQELGRLQVSLLDKVLVDVPLVAEKDIIQAGIFSRFYDWIILFFTRLIS